jgi:hypothetical protein
MGESTWDEGQMDGVDVGRRRDCTLWWCDIKVGAVIRGEVG